MDAWTLVAMGLVKSLPGICTPHCEASGSALPW